MGKLEKYSSYKDSGVEWLGKIPEHWEVKKIKHIGKIKSGDAIVNNELKDSGKYEVFGGNGLMGYCNRYNVTNENFIIGRVGAYCGNVRFNNQKRWISDNALIFSLFKDETYSYVFHLLTASRLNSLNSSNAQPLITGNKVLNFNIPYPPSDEQTKIALYLDEKISQLDNAISKKEKLIELLKEQKQITINDTVTRGLNKNVELIDSGVEWIGKIPKHWKLERLGSNFTERKEKVSDKDFEPLSVTKNGVVPQLDNAAKSNDGDNRKLVRNGDFVINSRSDRKGSSGLSTLDGSVSLINIVLKPITINPKFSHILLKSNGFIEEFYRNGHGIVADLWTTRYWDMKSIMLAIPPKDEQIQIVEYIEKQTTKIDKAIELQQNYISKLKEYKASLIDSVVTGKVKVP